VTNSDEGTEREGPHQWSVLFDLWLLQQAAYPLIESAIRTTGLSAEDFGLYVLLWQFDGTTPSDVARITGMRANTASAVLGRLDKRGHLERTPNEKDGRSVIVRLSPEGKAVCETALRANEQLLSRIEAELDGTRVQDAVVELDRVIRMLANMPPRPGSA